MTLPSETKNKALFRICLASFLITIILSGCSFKTIKKKVAGFDCQQFYPVCGEDATTYYNQCQAEDHSVKIAYDGACNNQIKIKTIPYEKINTETTKK